MRPFGGFDHRSTVANGTARARPARRRAARPAAGRAPRARRRRRWAERPSGRTSSSSRRPIAADHLVADQRARRRAGSGRVLLRHEPATSGAGIGLDRTGALDDETLSPERRPGTPDPHEPVELDGRAFPGRAAARCGRSWRRTTASPTWGTGVPRVATPPARRSTRRAAPRSREAAPGARPRSRPDRIGVSTQA